MIHVFRGPAGAAVSMLAAACALARGVSAGPAASPQDQSEPAASAVFFSPTDGVGALRAGLSREIRAARDRIDAALYTGMTVGTAIDLARAARAGIRVRVLVDPEALSGPGHLDPPPTRERTPRRKDAAPPVTERPDWHAILRKAGVIVRAMPLAAGTSGPSPEFHHKFAVIDGVTILTGSWNWSAKGDGINFENLVVIHDDGLAGRFAEEFERLWADADPAGLPANASRGRPPTPAVR